MGMRPRWIRGDHVISTTQRTVDRQFLFKPDPVVRNIIGASAARALERFPVRVHWLDFNINHEQSGLSPANDSIEAASDLVRFRQMFHSILAVELNNHLDREGAVFSSRSRDIPCVDDESVENRFFYALTNPVKDGLCDKVKHWGGFSSYGALGEGKVETFTYIDRTAWNRAGGERSKKPLTDFVKTITLEFSPLPGWEALTRSQRETRVRRRVRELEQKYREEREKKRRFAMTAERMAKVDHRDRPKQAAEKTKMPLCHAASAAAAEQYQKEYLEFRMAHRAASIRYLSGHFKVKFPKGSFRPPLIVCAA